METIDTFFLSLGNKMNFDDQDTSFRRIDGNSESSYIYFLPWNVNYTTARRLRLIRTDFNACYEIPKAIVSSTPNKCVESLQNIHSDFDKFIEARGIDKTSFCNIGLSMGNFPATYISNTNNMRLISVASGDRGERLVFSSPAARAIRMKAENKGYHQDDFRKLLEPYNPINNIFNLSAESHFIFGIRDAFIPKPSRDSLVSTLKEHRPEIPVDLLPFGHVMTLLNWSSTLTLKWQ